MTMTRTVQGSNSVSIHENATFAGRWLGNVVRRMRAAGVPDSLAAKLTDIRRARYSQSNTTWIDRAIDVASEMDCDAAAFALPDAIRDEIAIRRAARRKRLGVDVQTSVFDLDREWHEASMAIRMYAFEPSPTAAERVRDEVNDVTYAALRVRECFAATGAMR